MTRYIKNEELLDKYQKSLFFNEMTEDFKSDLIYIVESWQRKLNWGDENERRDYVFDNVIMELLGNWKNFDNKDPILTYYSKETRKLTYIHYFRYNNVIKNIKRTELIDKMLA